MRGKAEREKPYSHGHRHGMDVDPAFRGGPFRRKQPATGHDEGTEKKPEPKDDEGQKTNQNGK